MSNQSGYSSGFGWSQGRVTPQPHVKIPEGTYEEEHGRRGFFGRTSHLYHRHPPTGWLRIEGDLKPRAYYASKAPGAEFGRGQMLLENSDVRIGIAKLEKAMTVFARNGDGDEVRFIHEGEGLLETDYGDMPYRRGDYIVIPRGTIYKIHFLTTQNRLLYIESFSPIEIPGRYRNQYGQMLEHAPFCERDFKLPKDLETHD